MYTPKTVLDLRDSPWVDGPGRTVLDCAETIDPARYRIVVGAFDGGTADGTAYEQEARRRELPVVRIRERRSLDPRVLKQVIAAARQHRAALLHCHDFRSDVFGLAAARYLRLPVVATVHGWIANDFRGRLRSGLDKSLLRRMDHVIAVSEETRRRLGRWACEERCTVIPNALRVARFQPRRGPGPFRAAQGISDSEILVANIGRLSPEKGQLAFLQVARELQRRHRGLRFLLVGSGPDRAMLDAFVSASGLGDTVIFAGYRDDMSELYNEIDLVVQSSITEGMPNVLLEALLMEVPVIATDVGGTAEVVRDRRTGLLVPPGDHGALAGAIEQFLVDRQAFAAMARDGREDVAARFDHVRRVESLMDVYDRHRVERRRGR